MKRTSSRILDDFKQRQLYSTQSNERPAFGIPTFKQREPLMDTGNEKAFQSNINLRQVERVQGFGVLSKQQLERLQEGSKKKVFGQRPSQTASLIKYEHAPTFKPEKVADKVCSLTRKSTSGQEYIARTLTYQMHKERMRGSSWVMGGDNIR